MFQYVLKSYLVTLLKCIHLKHPTLSLWSRQPFNAHLYLDYSLCHGAFCSGFITNFQLGLEETPTHSYHWYYFALVLYFSYFLPTQLSRHLQQRLAVYGLGVCFWMGLPICLHASSPETLPLMHSIAISSEVCVKAEGSEGEQCKGVVGSAWCLLL